MINKLKSLIWKIRHRTIDKYHIIDSGLPPGYYDKDILILHANFNLLKDFVEIELASLAFCYNQNSFIEKFNYKFNPYWRDKSLGLKFLNNQINLNSNVTIVSDENMLDDNKEFSKEAKELYLWWINKNENMLDDNKEFYKEVKELYLWWINRNERILQFEEMPIRPDGVHYLDIFNKKKHIQEKYPDYYDEYQRINIHNYELEKKFQRLDDEMLIRLIKIRRGLWT